MRGSDPDATVYWLARMIAGGEDARFIARRIAVCATEDVGNADPMATVLAAAAVQISEFVGLPEAQLPLAQAAIYIACAPKSNAAASAIWQAVTDAKPATAHRLPGPSGPFGRRRRRSLPETSAPSHRPQYHIYPAPFRNR
ncbi:hypothetical protein ES703_35530 [subsurface metagenome]